MMDWIKHLANNRGSKGGSAKCAPGVYKSKMKDAVVPLCEEHFPDDKAKNEWLVMFYNQKDKGAEELKNTVNALAVEMGNDPPDMNKQLKSQKQKKRRQRLEDIAKTYDIKLNLPAKGPFGMDALLKVGGVCCDCGEDGAAFCDSSLLIGEETLKPPQAFWVEKGKRNMLKDIGITGPALAAGALAKLGFVKGETTEL